jgi:hypothetical protein
MTYKKKSASRTSKKDAKSASDRISAEQQAALTALHAKHKAESTKKRRDTPSNKKATKSSTAPLADEQSNPEDMPPSPTQTTRKSGREIRLTEKAVGGLSKKPRVKPKGALPPRSKAQRSEGAERRVLDMADSDREPPPVNTPDHGAERNNAMTPDPLAQHSGEHEANLERENYELRRWLIYLIY